ncbi:MAG TPA: hypothetical protein VNV87_00405 [Acidimicrobiales bacterium]|nr:hypothetical protein [Acidimicrobiales bacterium]
MTPEQAAVTVQEASDSDLDVAIGRALASAGISAEALKAEAAAGRFESDRARLAWFAISPFLD